MAGNQTSIFVRWDDKADVIQLDNHSPLISNLRDAFKAKHLAASTVLISMSLRKRMDLEWNKMLLMNWEIWESQERALFSSVYVWMWPLPSHLWLCL